MKQATFAGTGFELAIKKTCKRVFFGRNQWRRAMGAACWCDSGLRPSGDGARQDSCPMSHAAIAGLS
jgi:hypothetical protein